MSESVRPGGFIVSEIVVLIAGSDYLRFSSLSHSVVFVTQGKTSINCDNQPHTVTIAEASYPAVLRYSAIPKLSQHAYLKAKVTNTADYPLPPVSGDQNLVVELIEPKYKADTETLKMNENKYLEWLFKLKPGQVAKVPFSFSVTYPKNKTVYGL